MLEYRTGEPELVEFRYAGKILFYPVTDTGTGERRLYRSAEDAMEAAELGNRYVHYVAQRDSLGRGR